MGLVHSFPSSFDVARVLAGDNGHQMRNESIAGYSEVLVVV